ncbi:MAG: J domain-containing protein [Desertifilum sp.]|nr:J domain-containing protein [Desertifilum sp.]
MLNVERYYEILEVEPGASLDEIHQGYQDLATVWHPDRFTSHPRLRQKAQEKFQEINEAHEQLQNHILLVQARRSAWSEYIPTRPMYPIRVYRAQPQASVHYASCDRATPKREVSAWLD